MNRFIEQRHPIMRVVDLRAEHVREPLGLGTPRPRLSWRLESDVPGAAQVAYELTAGDWTSGRVESPDQVLVAWPAPPLAAREARAVTVRVWTDARTSAISEPLLVEAGLLDPAADWRAALVEGPAITGEDGPAVLLRTVFDLPAAPARARLYATAQGVYELELNGQRVGDHVLAPGWTSYHHRLRYQAFDVTQALHRGPNAMGGWLAEGWYAGRLGFRGGRRGVYGERTGLAVQLEVDCADGSRHVVTTDGRWRTAPSPITATGLYDGERYDARRELDGWSSPGFDDRDWAPATTRALDPSILVAAEGPPVRRTGIVRPVAVTRDRDGRTIADFGQNLTGRLRVTTTGERGTTVTLRHAEVLQDGELYTRPLREARATDEYTVKGQGTEVWEPRFTVHGFRYAEVTGGGPGTTVEAVVCHTDMVRTGWFDSSDPLLNRLHDNVVWSMRGNFLDVPTDCPQRDERLGWTGDLAVFAPTAAFLYDCAGLLTSWLADLAAEQAELGTVPFYVPWVELLGPPRPAAVWGDAAVDTPWTLFERFADTGVLRTQYPSMRAWVDQVAALAGEHRRWDTGFQFGDWLDPAAPPERPAAARTDAGLVATAAHARSARRRPAVADELGEADDQARYAAHAAAVAEAFNDEYVTPSGRLASDAQTAYALALTGGLLAQQEQRQRAGRRLTELVAAEGYRIGTGFAGTPLICDALTTAGAEQDAYHLLLQRECPSWLYPVTMGATTIWERWDSLLPDGTVNPGEMTSFNHYALGAVADWLHRTVAGLAPAAPGYRRVLVRPRPGGGLEHAEAVHDSPYGRIRVAWRRSHNRLHVQVTLPPGVTARVELPGTAETFEAGSGLSEYTCELRNPADDPRPSEPVHPFDTPEE
ncbi:alpha-L-rhamnosidase [Dactylosporangium matsuzakiense]|uniref:alpha-L-rhamnosidase n=2 Tax=Dactylosporangium matsuzakiense TaxID=53360 RepID=A0A9W6NQJ9_9ACTN|nr:alpha-L-rhamnosidase [Dactylosporangium matsuzakiense]